MSKPNFNKKQNSPENKSQGAESVKANDSSAGSESKDQVSEADTESEEKDPSKDPETDSDKTNVQAKADADVKAAAEVKTKVPKGMEMYFKNYPKEKTFFRTVDGQVFLAADKQWAVEHQKHVGGEIETIKRS
jgi:hypothetical protein